MKRMREVREGSCCESLHSSCQMSAASVSLNVRVTFNQPLQELMTRNVVGLMSSIPRILHLRFLFEELLSKGLREIFAFDCAK